MSSVERRVPRQARAERRVLALKEAAAAVIAEVGYEAATLTAVAAQAGASIGALYQYFPDKEAIARALADDYGREIGERWGGLVEDCAGAPLPAVVDRMCDLVLGYLAERPAFVPLLVAAPNYKHPQIERDRLRGHVAALLRAHRLDMAASDALRVAEVVVEVVKAISALIVDGRGSDPSRRRHQGWAADELRILLTAYLSTRLAEIAEAPPADA